MDDRPRRSLLYVPASSERMLRKAPSRGADAIIVDLEDGVLPEAKAAARDRAEGLWLELDLGSAEVLLRVNPPGTPWHEDDLAVAAGLRPHQKIGTQQVCVQTKKEDIFQDVCKTQVDAGVGKNCIGTDPNWVCPPQNIVSDGVTPARYYRYEGPLPAGDDDLAKPDNYRWSRSTVRRTSTSRCRSSRAPAIRANGRTVPPRPAARGWRKCGTAPTGSRTTAIACLRPLR